MDMVNFYGQADKEPPIINVVDQTPRILNPWNDGKNIGRDILGTVLWDFMIFFTFLMLT